MQVKITVSCNLVQQQNSTEYSKQYVTALDFLNLTVWLSSKLRLGSWPISLKLKGIVT